MLQFPLRKMKCWVIVAILVILIISMTYEFTATITVPTLTWQVSSTTTTARNNNSTSTKLTTTTHAASGLTTSGTTAEDRALVETPKIYVYPDPTTFEGFDTITGRPIRTSTNLTSLEFYNNIDIYFTRHLDKGKKYYHKTYFELEYQLLRGMYKRGRIVNDPNEANIFWIQHSLILHWIEGQPSPTKRLNALKHYYMKHLKPLLHHIYYELPYFNATTSNTSAKPNNHVFVYVMDNGPICEVGYSSELFTQDPFFNTIMTHSNLRVVGYYGMADSTGQRNWTKMKRLNGQEVEQTYQCYNPSKDITLPQYHTFDMTKVSTTKAKPTSSVTTTTRTDVVDASKTKRLSSSSILEQAVIECTGIVGYNNDNTSPATSSSSSSACILWYEYLHQRAVETYKPFYFRGQYNIPGIYCSKGIRKFLYEYCSSSNDNSNSSNNNPNDTGIGSFAKCYFLSNHNKHDNPNIKMSNAVFGLSPAGLGCWSTRLYDSFFQVTIPVILADNMVLPFNNGREGSRGDGGLDYENMVYRVTTGNPVAQQSVINDNDNDYSSSSNPTLVNELDKLVKLANDWIQTCRGQRGVEGRGDVGDDRQQQQQEKKCIDHPLSIKLAHIVLNRKWLGWGTIEETEDSDDNIQQGGYYGDDESKSYNLKQRKHQSQDAFTLFEKELMR